MDTHRDANPYQILDDILDLLLTITPDKAMAVECAGRAGIDSAEFDSSLELYDLLSDIVRAAFRRQRVPELLEEFAAEVPAQRSELLELRARYESDPPPYYHAPPIEAIADDDDVNAPVDGGGGRDLPDSHDNQPGSVESLMVGGLGAPEELAVDDIATIAPPAQPATDAVHTLRLDTGVPKSVVVGEAFQLAVTVRQSTSPKLGRDNLPVVDSSDLQVIWPAGASFITLRTQISAPDCIIDGPGTDTFKLFAGRDSPVFLYNLTPERTGPISILVSIYQEVDRLGTAGVETKARSRKSKSSKKAPVGATAGATVGGVSMTVQSVDLAPQESLEKLKPMRAIFVELFGRDRDAPRVLAEQAGLDVSLIPYSPRTADYLWDVLVEAQKRKALDKLIDQACERNADRKDDIRAAYSVYEKTQVV